MSIEDFYGEGNEIIFESRDIRDFLPELGSLNCEGVGFIRVLGNGGEMFFMDENTSLDPQTTAIRIRASRNGLSFKHASPVIMKEFLPRIIAHLKAGERDFEQIISDVVEEMSGSTSFAANSDGITWTDGPAINADGSTKNKFIRHDGLSVELGENRDSWEIRNVPGVEGIRHFTADEIRKTLSGITNKTPWSKKSLTGPVSRVMITDYVDGQYPAMAA